VEIKSANKLTDLKWLNLFDVDYLDQDGGHRSWQLASRSRRPKCITGKFNVPDAVVIVPFHTAEKKIVIIKEYRVPWPVMSTDFQPVLSTREKPLNKQPDANCKRKPA